MGLWNTRLTGYTTSYSFTIYKGSTTASDVLVSSYISLNVYGAIAPGSLNPLSEDDRLENPSSSLLLEITSSSIDNFYLLSVENATFYAENATSPFPLYAQVFPTTSAAYYKIIPTTIPSNIQIRFTTFHNIS
jgi:hypothetical protein